MSSPRDLLDRIAQLNEPPAPAGLRGRVAQAIHALDARSLHAVERALDEAVDLEDRSVRDVLGRDGKVVPVHHFRACRAEDAETSWDFRPPSPDVALVRDALMNSLLGTTGIRAQGVEALADAARSGKRFLFIANHESVFDLAVLPHALAAAGLPGLAERLTFFVNPKIFNLPFVNLFICKPIGLIKMPQSPRIAANESVMDAGELKRRAAHGFGVAGERLAANDSLVIYPEGLRSDGVLHRFAKAYLDLLRPESLAPHGLSSSDVLLVPWAHQGVRALEGLVGTAPQITVRFGAPVEPEEFFATVGGESPGVAAHLAGYLVARLLPRTQRGLYGDEPEAYLDHAHYRQRIKPHTLADLRVAKRLVDGR